MAKRWPDASTIRAETMARVSGILIRKVVPRPATDDSSMVPPMRSILVRTTSMPTPRPETLVTFSAVEKPARKMNCRICCSLMLAMAASVARPLVDRLLADALDVQPAAVIGDADEDMAAFVIGVQRDGAGFRLARGQAARAILEAVIGGIAHHMGERVLDHLQHLAVELGLGALHGQLDLLAGGHRQVAHDARQLVPGIADRLHAHPRHPVLQVGGDVAEALQAAP